MPSYPQQFTNQRKQKQAKDKGDPSVLPSAAARRLRYTNAIT